MQPEEPEDDAVEDEEEPEDNAKEDEAHNPRDENQDHEDPASPLPRPHEAAASLPRPRLYTRAPIVIPAGAEFLRSIVAAGKTKAPATPTAAGE